MFHDDSPSISRSIHTCKSAEVSNSYSGPRYGATPTITARALCAVTASQPGFVRRCRFAAHALRRRGTPPRLSRIPVL